MGIVFEATAGATRRDDYALAAGGDVDKSTQATIAAGIGSVEWSAVPSGSFDAAEDTVSWSIEAFDELVTAVVRVELSGPGSPKGIVARLRSGPFGGAAFFAPTGARCRLSSTRISNRSRNRLLGVIIGAYRRGVSGPIRGSRRRRASGSADFARSRLASPADDAFLAAILAAESDY